VGGQVLAPQRRNDALAKSVDSPRSAGLRVQHRLPTRGIAFRKTGVVTATRVLLDTNVWNYIVEVDGVEPLRQAARANRVAIVACPAVVYECLRVADPDKRRRRAKALAREDWLRLMPEAFSEAEDVRREMQRLRPGWLLDTPDLRQWSRNRADWQSGFWRRVRREPGVVAGHIKALGDDRLQQARGATKAARKQGESLGHTIHTFKWNRATGAFAVPTPGWDGSEFEAWRGLSVSCWWNDLILGESPTTLEWLGPWLDLRAVRSDIASWTRLWTREVETSALPREWIRWAMAETQATRTTSNGTPGDNQLATYLVDVDIFVTTDKVFVDLADAMRPHCPAPLAETRRSPAGSEALTFVLELLQSLS
jgi:predicted nucleic acid-binding protein